MLYNKFKNGVVTRVSSTKRKISDYIYMCVCVCEYTYIHIYRKKKMTLKFNTFTA